MREITLTFTEEEWISILFGELNEFEGFNDGVVLKIKNALCPNKEHNEAVNINPYGATTFCGRCGEFLWSIRIYDRIKHTFRYSHHTPTGRWAKDIIFAVGDKKDPKLVDISHIKW
jgi:hypothetical protein